MRLIHDSATSERQLMIALADNGRAVSVANLATWRKDGLLPPLSRHGRGQGRGKNACWHGETIVEQACAAFDWLARTGRPDAALRMLFLSGYAVPLPPLRRALLHHLRRDDAHKRRPQDSRRSSTPPASHAAAISADGTAASLLMTAALVLGEAAAAPQADDSAIVEIIEKALCALGRNDSASEKAQSGALWRLVRLSAAALGTAALLQAASGRELLIAQDYLRIALRFLGRVTGSQAAWLAERMGLPLFLLVLSLLRGGDKALLDDLAAEIAGTGVRHTSRQEHPLPASLMLSP